MERKIEIFLAFLFLIFYSLALIFSQKQIEEIFYAYISEPILSIRELKIEKREKIEPEINAKSVFSLRLGKKEKILFRKNIEEVLPIASLTKLMTAIIVFEENYNFSDFIKISKEAADQEDVPKYGNLRVGESIRIEKLLNLMLVYSSNDAAYALAEKIGVGNFVEKMNKKAKEIGLENTLFSNPTGLNEKQLNLSTAKEMMEMTKYILKERPEIFNITLEKGIYPVEKGIFDISLPENKKIVGGKTGYLPEVGGCMIFIFKDENENFFINIILGTPSLQERVNQMQKLVDWINYGKI